MAKSFKKFREDYEDDEWGDNEKDHRGKEKEKMKIRKQRRKKFQERETFGDDD